MSVQTRLTLGCALLATNPLMLFVIVLTVRDHKTVPGLLAVVTMSLFISFGAALVVSGLVVAMKEVVQNAIKALAPAAPEPAKGA